MKRLQRFTKIKAFRLALIAVLLGAIALVPWLLGLPNADKFGVGSGVVGLIITFWQLYAGMVKDEHRDFTREVDNLREILLREISSIQQDFSRDIADSENLYKELLKQQQETINYIIEKLNTLIIDVKSHEQLPGHSGTTLQVSELRREIAELRAGVAVTTRQGEILSRISKLENKSNG